MRKVRIRKNLIPKGQKKMKKFLAIVLSLIFALSACTVAFAADYECSVCHAICADEKALIAHNNGGCLQQFTSCQYCAARVETAKAADHEANCPKGAGKCEYCDASYGSQAEYEAHKAECKMITTLGSEDTAKIVDKIIEAVKGINWSDLANKVVNLVKGIDFNGIIAKVKPIFEKVVGLLENIELPEVPAAK